MATLEERLSQATRNAQQRLPNLASRAFSNRTLQSFEVLPGGVSNVNILLRFDRSEEALVLRIYVRAPRACRKEVNLLRTLAPHAPAPEIVYAQENGEDELEPFILYRYAEGLSYRELKNQGSAQDNAEAARPEV